MIGGILIIARNNLHLTKLTVKSALQQYEMPTVLVVDNASSDGTNAWLRSKGGVAYITYPSQQSLSKCWNAGLRGFWACGAECCLILNNDVGIQPFTFKCLREQNLPFVTGVSVDSKDQLTDPPDGPLSTRPHPDFSCFMIRPEVTDRVGWFNEDYYPAYVEDCEYHVRMHRSGIKAVCVDVPFYHASSQTIKQADPREKIVIMRGADANRQRFKRQYGCLPGTPEYEKLFL